MNRASADGVSTVIRTHVACDDRVEDMHLRHRRLGLAAVVFLGLSTAASAVHLQATIVRVGYQASGQEISSQALDHYRLGSWVPVVIELHNHDPDFFEGSAEVRQKDRDGDIVTARIEVAVRGMRRYTLYIPAGLPYGRQMTNQFIVRVFDTDDRLVTVYNAQDEPITEVLPPRDVVQAPTTARIALNVSERQGNSLRFLVGDHQLVREFVVGHIAPSDLPDNVAGLDMVDVVLWDAVDPSVVDVAQRAALLEWTRRGGMLVLGVGRNWQLVSQGLFESVLPAKLNGTITLDAVPLLEDEEAGAQTLSNILFGGVPPTILEPPLTCTPITLKDLKPGAHSVIPAKPASNDQIFVTRRPCERGHVVLVSCELRDLVRQGTQMHAFIRHVLEARWQSQPNDQDQYGYMHQDLFTYIDQEIGFQQAAMAYLLAAFAFVALYVAVATGGSWVWLIRRKMTQHAWITFSVIAVLGSGVSVFAVQLIRGIGVDVQEFTVVDARAGSSRATATSYLGLKAAGHMQVDLKVPTDWRDLENDTAIPASLRPLAPIPDLTGMASDNVFTAGQRYQAIPQTGELLDVPLRATLKQFEGLWQGVMDGRVNASLSRRPGNTAELSENSWIRNELPVDLEQCYLFIPVRNFQDGSTNRASLGIYALHDLSKLKSGDRITIRMWLDGLTDLERRRLRKPEHVHRQSTTNLGDLQERWLQKLGLQQDYYGQQRKRHIEMSTDQFTSAMLLMTTFDEIDPDSISRNRELGRTAGHGLDRSLAMTRDHALFVGFSEQPGPARLCYRKSQTGSRKWRDIEPDESLVMYRISMPIASP